MLMIRAAAPSSFSRRLLPSILLLTCLGVGCNRVTPPSAENPASSSSLSSDTPLSAQNATHALNRLGYGPRPGDARRLSEEGMSAWLERQLQPVDDEPELASLARTYPYAHATALELKHPDSPREDEEAIGDSPRAGPARIRRADILHQLQADQISRQVLSDHQLREVMVDFWFNHFNVDAQKGQVHFVAGDYVRNVIRRHALGNFEEMLLAVASHPAMLIYLDNSSSSAARRGPRGEHGGINENFARELLELHTVGVDGGYTQADVVEVARVLSGWGVDDLAFAYRDARHDRGEKTVMGREFAAGAGMDEGVALLRWLAQHPSTARFIARKLATRFVTDAPSDALVERIAAAWTESHGDIPFVLRAIVADPDFWDQTHRAAKVKTPLEWLVSAMRGIGATPSDVEIFRAAQRLGQSPYAMPIPTGYPERGEEWADGAQLGMRFQIAGQLANGRLPGMSYDPDNFIALEVGLEELIERLDQNLLGGASAATQAALRDRLGRVHDLERRRILGVMMALSSPEFQRQ